MRLSRLLRSAINYGKIPQSVLDGTARIKHEGDKGPAWIFFHQMSAKDRDTVDKWLVEIKHPLAYQPGTQEYRFKAICKELHQHGY